MWLGLLQVQCGKVVLLLLLLLLLVKMEVRMLLRGWKGIRADQWCCACPLRCRCCCY